MILRNLRSFLIDLDTIEALAHPLPRFPREAAHAVPVPLCKEARAWYVEELPAAFHKPAWDQRPADTFEKQLGRDRREQDRQSIRDIFGKASGAPMVDEARAWAEEYGVRFIVDYTCNVGGYYLPGTGTAAIARSQLQNPAKAAGILVHEITHAMQDVLGLLSPPNSFFIHDNTATAFTEAQATAFQRTAQAQAARVMGKKGAATRDRVLWKDFTRWYSPLDIRSPCAPPGSNGSYADIYGLWTARQRAWVLGLPDAGPLEINAEFRPGVRRDAPSELRTLEEDFMLLNADFKGRPWFDKSAAADFMKKALDPARAMRLYNRDEPPTLVRRVLLAEERLLNPLPFREQVKKSFDEVALYFAGHMLDAVRRKDFPPRRRF